MRTIRSLRLPSKFETHVVLSWGWIGSYKTYSDAAVWKLEGPLDQRTLSVQVAREDRRRSRRHQIYKGRRKFCVCCRSCPLSICACYHLHRLLPILSEGRTWVERRLVFASGPFCQMTLEICPPTLRSISPLKPICIMLFLL